MWPNSETHLTVGARLLENSERVWKEEEEQRGRKEKTLVLVIVWRPAAEA